MDGFGVLRPIRDEELELMLQWRNAPSVRRNMYTNHIISISEHINWWRNVQDRTDQIYFMYEYDGLALGIVGFNKVNLVSRTAEWAFYASPEAPRGTGSRMEFLALDYAFNNLRLHKLSCEVLDFNQSVIKLHEKFGFSTEGVFRQQHFVDGAYYDIHRLGILASEWAMISEDVWCKLSTLFRIKK
ncbi:UDP-4-amino-4,6-dideoxy-N-acetyl-beta-L-altrosamine N-acetyltransferase [Pseudomonas sp. F3-2]|uniref:UDP-4-amino-4, 6-dideoxy-N-acetyl-beta-L-altrosamine N-acetyltransferase n=1 Tax=Pseudomonas sp. F3-2 TaxID=3141539 RepID=UPI00315D8A0C